MDLPARKSSTIGKVLIISPTGPQTGNRATSCRIAAHLSKGGYETEIIDGRADDCTRDIAAAVSGVVAVVALHGYRSGRHLKEIRKIPYVIVFGGTDLSDPKYYKGELGDIQATVISQASALVAFSGVMCSRARELWPNCTVPIYTIPQAVGTLTIDNTFEVGEYLQQHCGECSGPTWSSRDIQVLLLPAGLRPVKDVLFVAAEASAMHQTFPELRFVIVGPHLDGEYTSSVIQQIKCLPGVFLVPPLESEKLYRTIQHSFAVVNSSISEGMCGVLLEAMHLRVPVIARNIPQNLSIVENGMNGFVYETPTEFVEIVKRLRSDHALRSEIVRVGANYVASNHSYVGEESNYVNLVRQIASTKDQN